jgi:hypothetical protein
VEATILSFKCVLWYDAQKIRYDFNGYIFKNPNGYMEGKTTDSKTKPKK